ncbi:hypothetical protein GSH03_34265 [Burkholderia pseudomallei]|nr:hypothetical protein [Burkholderia pseudomallei]
MRMPALRLAAANQQIGESLNASPPAPVHTRERTGESIGKNGGEAWRKRVGKRNARRAKANGALSERCTKRTAS